MAKAGDERLENSRAPGHQGGRKRRASSPPAQSDAAPPQSLVQPAVPSVVGIGASAGGLEALRSLVAQLPTQAPFAYVVVQHLSPTHQSMLVQLLARETQLEVRELEDGATPRENVIHVTPARWNVRLEDGVFRLAQATAPGTPKPSIDIFLTSLAEELGENAIAVVLSGTGSDGARGVRAVRAAGGITYAQDLESAKYGGMPRAAVDSGCVDFVLPPDGIAQHLAGLTDLDSSHDLGQRGDQLDVFQRVFELVRNLTGIDFNQYKDTTVARRVRRRMVATSCDTPEEYCALLHRDASEVQRLSQEMLISVTSFFRESESFKALSAVVADLVRGKDERDDIRIWVAGCATGEEAYSIAILFQEELKRQNRQLRLQLFATDVDGDALARARRGLYSQDELYALPAEHVHGYFSHLRDQVQVTKPLRDSILFAAHNLMRDPPFLRLDLVTCRNVLIYFKQEAQARLLRTFHAALRSGGALFLGRAETPYQQDGLFTAIDERARIYRRNEVTPEMPLIERDNFESQRFRAERQPPRARRALSDRVLDALHRQMLPGAVVVDEALNVELVLGDVTPFLQIRPGEPRLNLAALAEPGLRSEIHTMVLKVLREPHTTARHLHRQAAGSAALQLGVAALPPETGSPPAFLVTFQPAEPRRRRRELAADQAGAVDPAHIQALEEQLTATREHLHTVIEELETSNEELQSLNEELTSANEELQSTNEEMETSNEELQSTNEELTTVNEELETKTRELVRAYADLRNVKDSLRYPLLVLDEYLRVSLYNPPAARVFELSPAALGESLLALPTQLDLTDLRAQLESVVTQGTLVQREFNGVPSYVLQAAPYIDELGARKGVVLTFIDNTDIRQAQAELADGAQRLRASEHFIRSTLDSLPMHVCVIDAQGVIVAINRAWREFMADNGGERQACGLGVDYLAAVRRAHAAGDDLAGEFLEGLRNVMQGRRAYFQQEYPCDSREETRWFAVTVTPFEGEGERCFVIAHENITLRKARERLINLQARALDSSSDGILITKAEGHDNPLVYVNRAFEEITGYGPDEVMGRDARFLQGNDTTQGGLGRLRAALRDAREERVLLRNYRKDGSLFWNELSIYPLEEQDTGVRYLVGIQRDISSLVQSETALRASRERERLAQSFAGVGMLVWDVRGAQVEISEILSRQIGRPGLPQRIDQASFRAVVHEDDRPLFDDAVRLCLAGHESMDIEFRVVWADSSIHWLHGKGDVEMDGDGLPQRLLCLTQDITERKASDERVRFIAHHDALTGLPNRTLFRDRLQQALSAARRQRTKVGVAFVDLDHFKQINDSLGHHVGDQLLQAVARRLREITRESDTVCRYAGDEYVILLPNVHDSGEVSHVAEKIIESLSQPYDIAKVDVVVTPSVGLSLYPDDGESVDALLKNADAAMYHAKNSGRKTFQFFLASMNEKEQNRLALTTDLRRALEQGELEVHYQPQVAIGEGRVVGAEALVRWRHPERGLIYPDDFIPIAEDYELVISLGDWVLRESCRQARAWCDAGFTPMPIAVNFSAVQFRERGVVRKVEQVLAETGLDPALLEIELTESAIMRHGEETVATLEALRALGLALAIDDFGTGYSSLQHLRQFPIAKIKIDRSFVADLLHDSQAASIVHAIVDLGHSMRLAVLAEGVESHAQLDMLRGWGCDAYQGYLHAAAMSASAFSALLAPR